MRQLPKRMRLPRALRKDLADETDAITAHANPPSEAERRFNNARKTKWFSPVVEKLKKLSGKGQRCMLCSGSESSDVEHYRPKKVAAFAHLAMTWENFLWSCTPCNRNKGTRFPPDTEPGGRIVNPLEENVWTFFFIDEFGILTPRYDPASGSLDQRAVTTRDFLDLNREAVQESRKMRVDDLKGQVREALKLRRLGKLTVEQLRRKVNKWRNQPFQPDVADYFFAGPGRDERPFRDLLKLI